MPQPESIFLVAAGLLLATATVLVLWLRSRLLTLERALAQARLELEGANNRLAQTKNQAALQSRIDPVTGLLVRHVMVERFQFALALGRRQDAIFGVVLIELADFDHLTERQGQVEDMLLTALSTRLLTVTRETDMVGRVRDPEFAILLSVLRSADDLDLVVSKLRAALDATFTLPGIVQAFRLTMHFGSASFPRDGASWASVLKAADENLRLSRILVHS
jgi:diguanylate cyclase (GGDEF)-like protein